MGWRDSRRRESDYCVIGGSGRAHSFDETIEAVGRTARSVSEGNSRAGANQEIAWVTAGLLLIVLRVGGVGVYWAARGDIAGELLGADALASSDAFAFDLRLPSSRIACEINCF